MTTRVVQICLVSAVALFYTNVVFNNLTDFDSNYQFVRHVLMMDTTFPQNHGLWRAIRSPAVHHVFYFAVIAWEICSMLVLWAGAWQLGRRARGTSATFEEAKRTAIFGLGLSMLMWLTAFLIVGGEWFLMWQSRQWNGQDAAFRMFAVTGIVLLLLLHRDAVAAPEGKPPAH